MHLDLRAGVRRYYVITRDFVQILLPTLARMFRLGKWRLIVLR